MGFTSISEDSSDISFLLVENYNYDHSLWSSDRMGIFEPKLLWPMTHLFIASCPIRMAVKKRLIQHRSNVGYHVDL